MMARIFRCKMSGSTGYPQLYHCLVMLYIMSAPCGDSMASLKISILSPFASVALPDLMRLMALRTIALVGGVAGAGGCAGRWSSDSAGP